MSSYNENLTKVLEEGGVAVMPTDTIYGVVGKAEDNSTVERIYKIRKRSPEKPCIILIGDISELKKFSINLSEEQRNKIHEFWPTNTTREKLAPVSIVFDCSDDSLLYLHRGTNTLAFRVPLLKELRELLLKVGPLIAPSANPEGMPPAQNTKEAKEYFKNDVDLYVDAGEIMSKASNVIKLNKDGSIAVLRK